MELVWMGIGAFLALGVRDAVAAVRATTARRGAGERADISAALERTRVRRGELN